MSNIYLIKFEDDWADEMDLEGFRIMTQTELDEYKKILDRAPYPINIYYGTNEDCEYSSKADLLEHLKIKEITEDEAHYLKLTFGDCYGHFPGSVQILDFISEYGDSDEDEEDDD